MLFNFPIKEDTFLLDCVFFFLHITPKQILTRIILFQINNSLKEFKV